MKIETTISPTLSPASSTRSDSSNSKVHKSSIPTTSLDKLPPSLKSPNSVVAVNKQTPFNRPTIPVVYDNSSKPKLLNPNVVINAVTIPASVVVPIREALLMKSQIPVTLSVPGTMKRSLMSPLNPLDGRIEHVIAPSKYGNMNFQDQERAKFTAAKSSLTPQHSYNNPYRSNDKIDSPKKSVIPGIERNKQDFLIPINNELNVLAKLNYVHDQCDREILQGYNVDDDYPNAIRDADILRSGLNPKHRLNDEYVGPFLKPRSPITTVRSAVLKTSSPLHMVSNIDDSQMSLQSSYSKVLYRDHGISNFTMTEPSPSQQHGIDNAYRFGNIDNSSRQMPISNHGIRITQKIDYHPPQDPEKFQRYKVDDEYPHVIRDQTTYRAGLVAENLMTGINHKYEHFHNNDEYRFQRPSKIVSNSYSAARDSRLDNGMQNHNSYNYDRKNDDNYGNSILRLRPQSLTTIDREMLLKSSTPSLHDVASIDNRKLLQSRSKVSSFNEDMSMFTMTEPSPSQQHGIDNAYRFGNIDSTSREFLIPEHDTLLTPKNFDYSQDQPQGREMFQRYKVDDEYPHVIRDQLTNRPGLVAENLMTGINHKYENFHNNDEYRFKQPSKIVSNSYSAARDPIPILLDGQKMTDPRRQAEYMTMKMELEGNSNGRSSPRFLSNEFRTSSYRSNDHSSLVDPPRYADRPVYPPIPALVPIPLSASHDLYTDTFSIRGSVIGGGAGGGGSYNRLNVIPGDISFRMDHPHTISSSLHNQEERTTSSSIGSLS